MTAWRHSHFDPWGALFRPSEKHAILLSDVGCLGTIAVLYQLYRSFSSFETLLWVYIVPWTWVNHWIGKDFTSTGTRTPNADHQNVNSDDHIPAPYTSRRS